MTVPAPNGSDPLIDEVRQRRREMMQEYGNDLNKLFEEIQRRQAQHPEKCVDPRAEKQGRSRRATDRP
jgi:hypothetical protein